MNKRKTGEWQNYLYFSSSTVGKLASNSDLTLNFGAGRTTVVFPEVKECTGGMHFQGYGS